MTVSYLMRDILGGMVLPLRIYFQPRRFADEIAALAPDLPREYGLRHARNMLRDITFRRGVTRLAFRALVAMLWAPLVAGAFAAAGYHVNWITVAIAVAVGLGLVAAHTWGIVAFGLGLGVTSGVVAAVMFGVAFGLPFGITLGIVLGVILGIVLGVISGFEVNLPSSNHDAGAMWGAIGVAFWLGLLYGAVVGVVYGVREDSPSGVFLGIASAIAFGVPCFLALTHLHLFPFQALLNLAGWTITRFYPGLSPTFWRISPVRWDETILPPLPGLIGLLVTLNHINPALGKQAIAEVSEHAFQRQAARVGLARREALMVTSLSELAAFERGLNWLRDPPTQLPRPLEKVMPQMRDISCEVANALKSDSLAHRVRLLRLSQQIAVAASLSKPSGKFRKALDRWQRIIATGLEEAEQQRSIHEPIPQVYFKAGPLSPGQWPGFGPPFKGRTALFRLLESALEAEYRSVFVLCGQPRIGKTSTLLQLPHQLAERIIPAFLDLRSEKLGGTNDGAAFLTGVAEKVREEGLRHRRTILPLDRFSLERDPFPAFKRWLDWMERELDERRLLLCIDHFEILEEAISQGRFDTHILSVIHNMVQHLPITVLLSGNHRIDEMPAHWSKAFTTTKTFVISFLEDHEARELIKEPVAGFPLIYQPPAVNRIIEVTHCQPYLIQLMCALLVERMNAARRKPPDSLVTREDVDAIIPLMLAEGQNYFRELLDMLAGNEPAQRVLTALAEVPGKRPSSHPEYEGKTPSGAIETLLRHEIIERHGDGYRVTVPPLAEYLQKRGSEC